MSLYQYLRQGGCPEAAELLEATLNKDCNLPSRLDWTGREHKQTFAQIEKQYPKIRANHLTDLLKVLLKAKNFLSLMFFVRRRNFILAAF